MAFDFNNFGTKEQQIQLKAKKSADNFSFENFGEGETELSKAPEETKFNWLDPKSSNVNEEDKFGTKYIKNLWANYYGAGKGIQESVIKGTEKMSYYSPEASKARGENPFKGLAGYFMGMGETALGAAGNAVGAVFSPLTALGQTAIPQEEGEGLGAEISRGAVAGSPLGPYGAAGGAVLAGVFHGVNSVMEQPKIKEFLDANPNIRDDINNALNVGLAIVGTKSQKGPVSKAKGMMELPIEEFPKALAISYAKPVVAIAGKTAKIANTLAKFGASQTTGMTQETISTIINEMNSIPKEELKGYTRENIANEVISVVKERTKEVAQTGKEYEGIRIQNNPIKLKPTDLQQMIAENTGLRISARSKLISEADSSIRQPGEVAKLQQFYNRYQSLFEKGKMTSKEFLNMREDLANLAKFEGGIGRSAPLENLSGIMRGKLNTSYRDQIPGLRKLDAKFSPEYKQLKIIRKDYFNKDGTLKDGAISKIANLTGKGKEMVAERLEKVSPGIIQKVKILKALEDINAARSQKVGAYLRGATGGFLLSGGNVIAALASAILTSPDVAVPILKGYGKMLGVKESIMNKIISEVKDYVKNPKAGMMIEDINKLSDSEIKTKIIGLKKELIKMSDSDIRYTFKQNIYDQISEYENTLKDRTMGGEGDIVILAKKAIGKGDFEKAKEYYNQLSNDNEWKKGMKTFFQK